MSLVAYATSSGDESDNEDEQGPVKSENNTKSDGNENYEDFFKEPISSKLSRIGLHLPVPKNGGELSDTTYSLFEILPPPKVESELQSVLVEEDDEFLYKKATPIEVPKKVLPPQARNLVQITIPSLKDFDELDGQQDKKKTACKKPSSFSSLISILPLPKSEQTFVKAKSSSISENAKPSTTKPSFVPDTVKIRRPAQNTENIERIRQRKTTTKPKAKSSLVNVSDSEGSDLEDDFFSLTNDNKLPDVSAEEISAMVSKKSAEMARASSKFASITHANHADETPESIEILPEKTNTQHQLDKDAIQALIGSQAKRRKMDDVEVIDISSEEVLPNREEWLRSAIASATTYQPTGVLNDEEPAAGTRRKHQITYLAHKAKANEAELQAMWSANRQNRRQTQSKYGF